jgi:uncharacterized protein
VETSILQLGIACVAALAAGVIDAIAGGGGLLTVPTLLAVGLPPHLAIGTNKGQSVFGSAAALFRYHRSGLLTPGLAKVNFPLGLLGSALGAQLVLLLAPSALRPVVLVMLVVAAVVMMMPRPSQPKARPVWMVYLAVFVIAAYDGFFGPGTGTFLLIAFMLLAGHTVTRATADAKTVNFASNIAALALFAWKGAVLWKIALPMAAFQMIGGYVGAHLAIKGGDKFIRRVVVGVVLALSLKVAFDFARQQREAQSMRQHVMPRTFENARG